MEWIGIIEISSEAYPTSEITHLTLAYNINQLQHSYKRRFGIYFNCCFVWWDFIFFCISELNLRIWQQSKKMHEQTGQRPVVYNNKCGQMCGVSV